MGLFSMGWGMVKGRNFGRINGVVICLWMFTLYGKGGLGGGFVEL